MRGFIGLMKKKIKKRNRENELKKKNLPTDWDKWGSSEKARYKAFDKAIRKKKKRKYGI